MKYKILIVLLYILLDIALSPLRNVSFMLSSAVSFIFFFFVTAILIDKLSGKISSTPFVLCAVLGMILFNLPFTVYGLEESMISRLDEIIRTLGVVAGWGFTKINGRYTKLIYTAVCLMISTSISLQGNEWWVERFHPCSEYNKAKQQQVEKTESLNR